MQPLKISPKKFPKKGPNYRDKSHTTPKIREKKEEKSPKMGEKSSQTPKKSKKKAPKKLLK